MQALTLAVAINEGKKPHVYLDTMGHPTVGIGFNLDRSNARAMLASVGANYDSVRSGGEDLTEAQINELFSEDIQWSISCAEKAPNGWSTLKNSARLVAIDMSFNLGCGGYNKFVNFNSQLKSHDYSAAADNLRSSALCKQTRTRCERNVDLLLQNTPLCPGDDPNSSSAAKPVPVHAPTPKPVPVPAPKPVPVPAPKPVPVPAPKPVPVPTSKPVPVPTPKPVLVPAPKPVPVPASKPVHAPTPKPVHAPTPKPVHAPTPKPVPVPARKPVQAPTNGKTPSQACDAVDYFVSNGWTFAQAAGIVGNLIVGSNLNPGALGDSGKAYGIAQWHPDRQAICSKFLDRPIKGSSVDEQLECIENEFKTIEARAAAKIKTATTAADAAALCDQYYARTSGVHRQNRITQANNLANGGCAKDNPAPAPKPAPAKPAQKPVHAPTPKPINKGKPEPSPAHKPEPEPVEAPTVGKIVECIREPGQLLSSMSKLCQQAAKYWDPRTWDIEWRGGEDSEYEGESGHGLRGH